MAERLRQVLALSVVDRGVLALEQREQHALAERKGALLRLHAHGAANGRAGLAGRRDGLPVGGRQVVLVADNLDFVARLQARHQRHDGAVDLGAHRGVADVGVERVGEVDGRGAARQRDQPAARGEAEHLVLEQLELGVFEEIFLGRPGGDVFDGLAQPGEGLALVANFAEVGAFLVGGVCGDAVFGDAVHLLGADLQLDTLPAEPDDGGVDRAVVVMLGDRDVVLEASWNDFPVGMHDAQRPVAVGNVRHDDAKADHVRELLEGDLLAIDLGGNRPRRFHPRGDPRRRCPRCLELVGQLTVVMASMVSLNCACISASRSVMAA